MSAGGAAVVTMYKAGTAVFGFELIMGNTVTVYAFAACLVTVFNLRVGIIGASIATFAISGIITAAFVWVWLCPCRARIGIIWVLFFAGALGIFFTSLIFAVTG